MPPAYTPTTRQDSGLFWRVDGGRPLLGVAVDQYDGDVREARLALLLGTKGLSCMVSAADGQPVEGEQLMERLTGLVVVDQQDAMCVRHAHSVGPRAVHAKRPDRRAKHARARARGDHVGQAAREGNPAHRVQPSRAEGLRAVRRHRCAPQRRDLALDHCARHRRNLDPNRSARVDHTLQRHGAAEQGGVTPVWVNLMAAAG